MFSCVVLAGSTGKWYFNSVLDPDAKTCKAFHTQAQAKTVTSMHFPFGEQHWTTYDGSTKSWVQISLDIQGGRAAASLEQADSLLLAASEAKVRRRRRRRRRRHMNAAQRVPVGKYLR